MELGWIRNGAWRGFTRLDLALRDGKPVSLDARLREAASGISADAVDAAVRTEQMAVLARWFYSSWRDGELLLADAWEKLPWRKVVNAVSRVASANPGATPPLPNLSTHSSPTGSPPLPDPPRNAD